MSTELRCSGRTAGLFFPKAAGRMARWGGYLLATGLAACGPGTTETPPGRVSQEKVQPAAPYEAAADLSRGLALVRQGQLDEGLGAVREALKKQPDDAMILFALARVLHLQTHLGEAEVAYRKALARQPGMTRAWLRLSEIQLEQGRLQDALESVDRLAAVHGGGAQIDYQRGFILSKMGRFEAAEESLKKSLRQRPQNADAWYVLGVNEQRQGRDAAAVEAFRKVLQVDRAYMDAWFNLGNSLSRLGREKEALKALEQFQQVNRKVERTKSLEATLRVLRTGTEMAIAENRLGDAEAQLLEAEEKSADRPWMERLRGELLLARHEDKAALKRLHRAAALNPAEMTERLALAAAFRRAGLQEQAQQQEAAARSMLSSPAEGGS